MFFFRHIYREEGGSKERRKAKTWSQQESCNFLHCIRIIKTLLSLRKSQTGLVKQLLSSCTSARVDNLPERNPYSSKNVVQIELWRGCPSLFIHPGKSLDHSGWKELNELRQRQAQMQTRLPARLAAPKLPSLAHVISLEQSREEGKRRGRWSRVSGHRSWFKLWWGLSLGL